VLLESALLPWQLAFSSRPASAGEAARGTDPATLSRDAS
jgi:hypothetical protein